MEKKFGIKDRVIEGENPEYLLYDISVGISGAFSPKQEQRFFIVIKNNKIPPLIELDQRVIDYVEKEFTGKKVLNITFRKETLIVVN